MHYNTKGLPLPPDDKDWLNLFSVIVGQHSHLH